jgi:hypothetical protein
MVDLCERCGRIMACSFFNKVMTLAFVLSLAKWLGIFAIGSLSLWGLYFLFQFFQFLQEWGDKIGRDDSLL